MELKSSYTSFKPRSTLTNSITYNSIPRNPLIADACYKAGYIDTWGRGTLKIIKACEDAGLPAPRIIEKDGGIEVTLFKVEMSEVDFGINPDEFRNKFGINVEATYKLIFENPYSTSEELARKLGVTSRTIKNHQAKLKESKFIERVGEKIGGYWKLSS